MYTLLVVLNVIMQALLVWMSLTLFFQLFVSLFGFKKSTADYQPHPPQLRFLILIPAHNEEEVIAGIIGNMNRMDYPRELYDCYVLADNCTDRTVQISQALGANVLEFHKERPDEPTGKSVVLRKALNALEGYQELYDAVFIFDADNLVDLNMFREVNSQFLDNESSAEVVQCYLGCKNKTGLVALFYYMTYTISNRFLQYSRQRLGLNCGIGGTGFAVRTRYLYHRGGWTVKSLTEDTELQFAATLEGRRVLWNNHVRVYDEKPTKWNASLRQRIRWAQGHWFVAFRNTFLSIKAVFTRKISVGEFISMFVQMYFPSTYVAATLNILLAAVINLLLLGPARDLPNAEHMVISLTPTIMRISLFVYM
ncbi:MAG: glycosyltransferase family 2 protein, partial [Eubacteriales bacterium]|nr:glycosyltransferase family 2 protein [Eubacteriales bacterium]